MIVMMVLWLSFASVAARYGRMAGRDFGLHVCGFQFSAPLATATIAVRPFQLVRYLSTGMTTTVPLRRFRSAAAKSLLQ